MAAMSPAPILEVRDVTVRFDGFTVLDGLNFSIARGELRFLIGPNGAGKTTLLDIITGKTKPAAGRVLFDGRVDLIGRGEANIARLGIGRKFQTPAVFRSLSVFENIEAAAGYRHGLLDLLRRLSASDEMKLRHTLEEIGLAARAGVPAGTRSPCERQWLEIGMLLVQEPMILLL